MRTAIRAAADRQALAAFTETTREWMAKIRSEGPTKALDEPSIQPRGGMQPGFRDRGVFARDAKFGDDRTAPDE